MRISLDADLFMVKEAGAPRMPGDWCRWDGSSEWGRGERCSLGGPTHVVYAAVLTASIPTAFAAQHWESHHNARRWVPPACRDMNAAAAPGDIVRFPYAVVEIKLQTEPPAWLEGLLQSGVAGLRLLLPIHGQPCRAHASASSALLLRIFLTCKPCLH